MRHTQSLLSKKQWDEYTVERIIDFYKNCLSTLGMNTSNGIHQVDLRGHSINRDEYFEEEFRKLENDEGLVNEAELAETLMDNPKFFKTDKSVISHIENRKSSGWLYAPKAGMLRRQGK